METLLNLGWWVSQNILATLTLLLEATQSIHSILAEITDISRIDFQLTQRLRDAVGLIVGHGLLLLWLGLHRVGKGTHAQQGKDKEQRGLHDASSNDIDLASVGAASSFIVQRKGPDKKGLSFYLREKQLPVDVGER